MEGKQELALLIEQLTEEEAVFVSSFINAYLSRKESLCTDTELS